MWQTHSPACNPHARSQPHVLHSQKHLIFMLNPPLSSSCKDLVTVLACDVAGHYCMNSVCRLTNRGDPVHCLPVILFTSSVAKLRHAQVLRAVANCQRLSSHSHKLP